MARGVRRGGIRFFVGLGAVMGPGLIVGCPGIGTGNGGGGSVEDGNRDPSVTSPLGKTSGEPNGSFDDPIVAVFKEDGVARLQGLVSAPGDLDVYLLGGLSAGDRIVVDAFAYESSLDVTVALFDAQERLAMNNDDRTDVPGGSLDAYVDFVVRHGGERYYVVVSGSPFGATRRLTGGYRVDVRKEGVESVPEPTGQVIVLDFDGAVINSAVLGEMTLAPFDAGAVSPLYSGETEAVKQSIRAVFEQDYERFNVTVLTSDDPLPTVGTQFTSVFFGGFDNSLFGIAESVDLYNAEFCDDAIIFAESFVPEVFSGAPSAEELGVAIGNVAAHEAGHVLGLNHTDDDLDIMDDQSPADAFLQDQEFMTAPLSDDIMPIGFQDGVLLLNEIVGPR